MKVRKLGPDGDYSFGHGASDFLKDKPAAVAQSVQTRLALWQGKWFLDTESGTPWLQEILGYSGAYEQVIRSRILETGGVKSIETLDLLLNPDERRISITAELNTAYGTAEIQGDSN